MNINSFRECTVGNIGTNYSGMNQTIAPVEGASAYEFYIHHHGSNYQQFDFSWFSIEIPITIIGYQSGNHEFILQRYIIKLRQIYLLILLLELKIHKLILLKLLPV